MSRTPLTPAQRSALTKQRLRDLHDAFTSLAPTWRGTYASLAKAARQDPNLTAAYPTTLAANIQALATHLAIPLATMLDVAVAAPQLMALKPAPLAERLKTKAAYLNMPVQDYLVTFGKHAPATLYRTFENLTHFVSTLAEGLPLPPETVKGILRRTPAVGELAPETLLGNFETLLRELPIERSRLLAAISTRPALLWQAPATIRNNAERSSAALNIPYQDFVAAAMTFTGLLTSRPDTLAAKAPLICALATVCGIDDPLADIICKMPIALTFSLERLESRLALAKSGLGPRSFARILQTSEEKAQELLNSIKR